MIRLFRTGLAAVLAAALLLLCVGCQHTPAKDPSLTKVSLCEVTHSVFYAPQYVALSQGYFEEEGLSVELSTGEGADKVMAAVLSGGIDIGFAGPEASIYVYAEGRDNAPRVFAQMTQRDGSFLVARQKNEAFAWNQLKGHTVLPGRVGGVPYMTLCYVLKHTGNLNLTTDLTLDSSIQYALMTSAFVNGTGDYVTAFEPTASTLEKNGQGYVVASIGEAGGDIPYTAYFAAASYLKEHPDTVQAFTNAIYKGLRYVASHSAEEIARAVAPYFADTEQSLLVSAIERYKSIDAWCNTPLMKEESYRRLQTIMMEAGELKDYVPYEPVVDTVFAQKALDTGA